MPETGRPNLNSLALERAKLWEASSAVPGMQLVLHCLVVVPRLEKIDSSRSHKIHNSMLLR